MSSFLLLRLLATTALVVGLALLVRYLLKRTFPRAWQKWSSHVFVASIVGLVAGIAVWIIGAAADSISAVLVGVHVVGALMVTAFLLLVSAPLWAGLPALLRIRRPPPEPDNERRTLLKAMGGALPAAAAAAGPIGAVASGLKPVLRKVDIPIAGLAPGLNGLKILQLTDIHIGAFIGLDQVEAAVEVARPEQPHLVALTGDIADDYGRLGAVIDTVASLQPALGVFGVYGNHEVYRGKRRCAEIYARSPAQLLVDDGVVLEHNGAQFWLCGTDDPATLGRDHRPFLSQAVRRSMAQCPPAVAARILLSHRPEGFEEASRLGVDLTLAGHTHGAQAAFFGRSWLEWLLPRNYLLGLYRSGESHLYTSAGLGHWFPFRLNCPCEAALVTLRTA